MLIWQKMQFLLRRGATVITGWSGIKMLSFAFWYLLNLRNVVDEHCYLVRKKKKSVLCKNAYNPNIYQKIIYLDVFRDWMLKCWLDISKVQCTFTQFLQVHMKFAQNKWPSFDDSSFLCNSIHSHLVFWKISYKAFWRIFSNFCTKVGVENSRFKCILLQTTKYWLNYWKINFFLLLREISIAHAHSPNTILNISRGIKHFLDFLHNCLCNKVISALFLHMHSASADYGRCRTQNKSQFHEIFTTADGRTLCLHTIV